MANSSSPISVRYGNGGTKADFGKGSAKRVVTYPVKMPSTPSNNVGSSYTK